MATDSAKNIPSSSDDDSGDEDASGDRRRRFCIERVPDAPPAVKVSAKRDRSTLDYDGSGYSRNTSKRRMTSAPHFEARHDQRRPYPRPSFDQRHQSQHSQPQPRPHLLSYPYPYPHQQPHSYSYQPPYPSGLPLQHPYHQQHQQQHQYQQQQQHQYHYNEHHEQDQRHAPHQEPRQIHVEELIEVATKPESPRKPAPSKEPPGPIVFINPKMLKKFISKSIELASSSSNQSAKVTTSSGKGNHGGGKHQTFPTTAAATSSTTNMVDLIDLRTSSRESLQAASTMAVIRLVTECIKNDNKRDEKHNKVLVARLIDQLTKHEREHHDGGSPQEKPYNKYGVFRNHDSPDGSHCGISDPDAYELGAGGLPIPVIGGSASNRYISSNSRGSQYPLTKQQGPQYQYRPRHVSSDRRDSRHSERQNNKLRNYSR